MYQRHQYVLTYGTFFKPRDYTLNCVKDANRQVQGSVAQSARLAGSHPIHVRLNDDTGRVYGFWEIL